jgi:hypothetical protein
MSAAALVLAAAALTPPEIVAVRTSSPPVIDGRLDDESWQLADASDEFTQKLPFEGAAPSEPTTLRVLYDQHALYVSFDCTQRKTPIVRRLTRRDGPLLADTVTFAVGSRADGKSAFEFSVNAAGTLADGLRYNDTELSAEWDESWQARVALTDHGWSAEIRVPLRVLRFGAAPEQSWDFQARRYIAVRQETIEWRHIARNRGGEVSQYGKLTGLSDLGSSALHWEVRPFMVGRLRRVGGVPGVGTRVEPGDAIGVDLRFQASRALTLDATFNPDFAQIEADQQLLNLGNVETFYPEKRPFFLEGSEVFATPLMLLYTRRIGRAPEEPDLLGDAAFGEQLVDVASPAPLLGALKLTGKLGGDWTVGALQALTAPARLPVAWSDGRRQWRVIEPTTAFGAARVRRDLPGGSHVGATLTAVQRLEPERELASLEPAPGAAAHKLCPGGQEVPLAERCFNDAYVGSLDLRWRSRGGDWVGSGQLTGSMLHGGPPRHTDDGGVIEPGELGEGAYVQLARRGGAGVLGDVSFEYADRDLDYTDLGYSEGSNRYRVTTNLVYHALAGRGMMRETTFHAEQLTALGLDGWLVSSVNKLGMYGTFDNGLEYSLYVHYQPRYYDDREVGNGLALERAPAAGVEIELWSDRTRSVAFELFTLSQWIETGANFSGTATLALRPAPELSLELNPTLSYTVGEPRFALEGNEPAELLFGALTAKSASLQLRASYAFSAELTLQAYGQLYLASGHFTSLTSFDASRSGRKVALGELTPYTGPVPYNPDFQEGVVDLNLVFHWEYSEGASLYGVYTRSAILDAGLPLGRSARLDFARLHDARAVDTLLFKLSYWWGN